ncbi:MAG: hypothetical protein QOJ68_2162 [Blastococcus sp.]|jgi:hypothetical protein|nr:hypothetical protein [Blastococcus sp.]
MKSKFTLGALLAAMAALMLAFASPALAKGGTGGGGGGGAAPCATITSWTPSVQTIAGGPVVVLDVGVFNGCLDEGAGAGAMPVVGLTTTDPATGAFLSRSAIMASYGQMTYRFYLGAPTATPPARTVTVDVIRANGSVQDRRTTTLADVVQAAMAASAVQPAA